ncbi:MAG: hypothetical protein IPH11_08725 [Ignavibacteriales bacterium]|nr:hypothetical protein [Ignavibacteriales bacterium]
METIKAFIGHSFDDSDKTIVTKFLEIFNTIRDLNISFSWDHAEKAEVDILSNKVLQKMKEANTFIGICTKKERVIKNLQLKKSIFNQNHFHLKNEDYEWKTSDWIIQEIGCAFGREMKIILLVETGLRQPGGLQGNLEYIEFERENPEKVFKKILEMIQNLLPKVDKEIVTVSDKKEQPLVMKETESIEESKEKYQIEIKNDWSKDEFLKGLIGTILLKDDDRVKEIIEKYTIKYCQDNREDMQVFKAKSLYYYYVLGNKKDSLEEMKQILKEYPNSHEINEMIGEIYQRCEQYDFAYNHFYAAYQNCEETKKKIKNLSSAIISYQKSEKKDYKDFVATLLSLDENGTFREIFYSTISQLAKLQKDDYLYFLILEAALNDFPLNSTFRFDLAYRYSEVNNNEMAYYHYNFLTKHFDEGSSYWNNYGVTASQLKFPNKAISAYRKSEELGETLAMSNIAYKFITEGFFSEAELICRKALEIKNYDKHVLSALSQIETNKTNEIEKENKLLENARLKRINMLQISKGLLLKQVKEINKYYQHPDCILDVIIRNDSIKFSGTYSQKDLISTLIFQNTNPSINWKLYTNIKLKLRGPYFAI